MLEPDHGAISTRANTNLERFRAVEEADKYAEYVAMVWREPEVQDVGKVVFNKAHRRTEGNVIQETLIYLDMEEQEAANIYSDQAMKTMGCAIREYMILSQAELRTHVLWVCELSSEHIKGQHEEVLILHIYILII